MLNSISSSVTDASIEEAPEPSRDVAQTARDGEFSGRAFRYMAGDANLTGGRPLVVLHNELLLPKGSTGPDVANRLRPKSERIFREANWTPENMEEFTKPAKSTLEEIPMEVVRFKSATEKADEDDWEPSEDNCTFGAMIGEELPMHDADPKQSRGGIVVLDLTDIEILPGGNQPRRGFNPVGFVKGLLRS